MILMQCIAMGLAYSGQAYHGWQRQSDQSLPTIQGALESALFEISRHPIKVVCSGRTDKGVHAHCQVVHFHSPVERSIFAWQRGVNAFLPKDIRVRFVKEVPEDFHARFSATARRYHYVIDNQAVYSVFGHGQKTWLPLPLDVEAMAEAAQCLLGRHDFRSFQAVGCQAHSPIRTVSAVSVWREGHDVHFTITANAFLYHMVRNIIGTLLPVGYGELTPLEFSAVLTSCDRTVAGATAPSEGLFFVAPEYPEHFALPLTKI